MTAIFAKIGVADINSDLPTLGRTVVIAVILAGILALTKLYQSLASISAPTVALWQMSNPPRKNLPRDSRKNWR